MSCNKMDDKHRVLVVEDEALLAKTYKEMLVRDGCAAKAVPTGDEALRELDSNYYDLVLLDINLAGALNGFAVLERIRKKGRTIRVVILTSHGNPYDIERGLTLKADNYLVKPMGTIEFTARIRAELRQVAREGDRIDPDDGDYDYGDIRVKIEQGVAKIENQATGVIVPLGTLESKLIVLLLRKAGSLVPLDEIGKFVWDLRGNMTDYDRRNLNQIVFRLRKKIEPLAEERSGTDSSSQGVLVVVRNQGLMLRKPV